MTRVYWPDNVLAAKEQKVSEVKWKGAKYVLIVKAFAPIVSNCVNRILEVELSRNDDSAKYAFDTVQMRSRGTCDFDTPWAWPAECALPLPDCTEEIFNAHWGMEAPKPDTLPGPVRQALDEADLGCRRDGVQKLIEAIYSNPPKVSP